MIHFKLARKTSLAFIYAEKYQGLLKRRTVIYISLLVYFLSMNMCNKNKFVFANIFYIIINNFSKKPNFRLTN